MRKRQDMLSALNMFLHERLQFSCQVGFWKNEEITIGSFVMWYNANHMQGRDEKLPYKAKRQYLYK